MTPKNSGLAETLHPCFLYYGHASLQIFIVRQCNTMSVLSLGSIQGKFYSVRKFIYIASLKCIGSVESDG